MFFAKFFDFHFFLYSFFVPLQRFIESLQTDRA